MFQGQAVNEEQMDSIIDLRMHMDRSPYTVNEVNKQNVSDIR